MLSERRFDTAVTLVMRAEAVVPGIAVLPNLHRDDRAAGVLPPAP